MLSHEHMGGLFCGRTAGVVKLALPWRLTEEWQSIGDRGLESWNGTATKKSRNMLDVLASREIG